MLGYSSANLAYLGYLDQARARADEGVLEARRLRHFYTLGFCLQCKCWTSLTANMMHEVRKYADELFELSNEHGFPLWAAGATFYRGVSSSALGEASQGVRLMSHAWKENRVMGHVLTSARHLAYLAKAHATLGHPAEGLSKLRDAQELIETTDERHDEAEVHRLRGDLLHMTGDDPSAERSYHRALDVAKQQNTRTHELRAAMSMARLWRDQGKRDQARELLAPVYGWFTEGFDTFDLKEAKALLHELKT
jgi:predicted ATPase